MDREQVLAKLRERIVLFAASHLSRDAAEDLAQEVLLLLHEKYAHLERVEDLLPLSLQIVRFKIMSQRRKSVRRGEYTQVSITDIQLPDLDANPAEYVERKQILDRLAKAIKDEDFLGRLQIANDVFGVRLRTLEEIAQGAAV